MYNGSSGYPYAYMKPAEEVISDEYKQLCSIDDDCPDSDICFKIKAQYDETNKVWAIFSNCYPESFSIEETCNLIGDFTEINDDDFEEEGVPYSVSYNCDRYKVDIGGAFAIGSAMIAAFTVLLLAI